ncbi:MAG TPA: hypothetical protein VH331_02990 [Allosphingosinicella sp.]|nr:hypothetical protein [Allosphingosinicella sp.]
MNRTAIVASLFSAATLLAVAAASASDVPHKAPPMRVGTCALTRVKLVGTRLVDGSTNRPVPGSGSAVEFRNGLGQVSYEQVPAVDHSRAGDPVYVCLMKLPRNCPPGDNRGKLYTTTNLRTLESWTLPDAEHMCGGA